MITANDNWHAIGVLVQCGLSLLYMHVNVGFGVKTGTMSVLPVVEIMQCDLATA